MAVHIAKSAVVYPDVILGSEGVVDDFVLLGVPFRGAETHQLSMRIGENALIRSHSVIYSGNIIGANFQTGHGVMVRELNEIGNYVSVGTHSIIEHHIKISDHVRIHSNVFIPEYSILEEGCWLGPNVVCTNARYPLSPKVKENLKGPLIHRGAKIGANVTLLPGVVIGVKALVGAGSVVVHDVPDYKIVVGNPARIMGDIQDLEAYQD
jgi:acetyltransferase-like isoleucine patch superfamily enzyme